MNSHIPDTNINMLPIVQDNAAMYVSQESLPPSVIEIEVSNSNDMEKKLGDSWTTMMTASTIQTSASLANAEKIDPLLGRPVTKSFTRAARASLSPKMNSRGKVTLKRSNSDGRHLDLTPPLGRPETVRRERTTGTSPAEKPERSDRDHPSSRRSVAQEKSERSRRAGGGTTGEKSERSRRTGGRVKQNSASARLSGEHSRSNLRPPSNSPTTARKTRNPSSRAARASLSPRRASAGANDDFKRTKSRSLTPRRTYTMGDDPNNKSRREHKTMPMPRLERFGEDHKEGSRREHKSKSHPHHSGEDHKTAKTESHSGNKSDGSRREHKTMPKLERKGTDTSIRNRSEEFKAKSESQSTKSDGSSPKVRSDRKLMDNSSKRRLERSRSRSKRHVKSQSERKIRTTNTKDDVMGDTSHSKSVRVSRRKRIERSNADSHSTRRERARGSSVENRTRAHSESRRSSRRGHSVGANRRRRENGTSERRRESRRRGNTNPTLADNSDRPKLERTQSRNLSDQFKRSTTRSMTPPPRLNRTMSQSEHAPSSRRHLSSKVKDPSTSRRNRRSNASVDSTSHTMHSASTGTLPTLQGDSSSSEIHSATSKHTRTPRRHRRRPSDTGRLAAALRDTGRPVLLDSSNSDLEEHSDIFSVSSDTAPTPNSALEDTEPEKRSSGGAGRAKKALKMLKKTVLGSKKYESFKQSSTPNESLEDS